MNLKNLLLLLIITVSSPAALALSSDKDKPMQVEADSVEIDDKRGFTVYRGKVIVVQGSMKATGDTLVIERVDGEVKTVTLVGKPATYRQRPDNKPKDMEAYAIKLQMFPQKDLVRLERNAKVIQEGDVFTGNLIKYDKKNDRVIMKGDIKATDTGPQQKGRVRMTIQPNK